MIHYEFCEHPPHMYVVSACYQEVLSTLPTQDCTFKMADPKPLITIVYTLPVLTLTRSFLAS